MRRHLTVTLAFVGVLAGGALPALAADGSDLVNLALGKVATESSSERYTFGTPADRAVDGDTNGDYADGSVAVTYRVTDAWWEVDLGAVATIDHIVVWNRTDCCSDRLKRFHVFVSDVPFEVKDIVNTATQDGVLDVFRRKGVRRSAEIPIHRTGRYVRIQLEGLDAVLQLAEVQVMGWPGVDGPPDAVAEPAIEMTARVQGDRAETAPGPTVDEGKNAKLTFEVTNIGWEELSGLWVNLPGEGAADCPQTRLLPGESVSCSLRVRAQTGPHTETARAEMTAASGVVVAAQTRFHYFVPEGSGAAAQLEFLVDGLNGDVSAGPRFAKGEKLTFSYIVSNVGGRRLTDVRVTDDRAGRIACPSRTVDPGEIMVCTRTWTARLTETSHLATVTADRGVRDTERLYYHVRDHGREDRVSLVVTVNGDDANEATGPMLPAGSSATLHYILTNRTGDITNVYGAEIIDPRVPAGQMRCTGGPTLEAGESMICTATVTVTEGQWSNVVIGHAWSSNGPRLDTSDRVNYYGMP